MLRRLSHVGIAFAVAGGALAGLILAQEGHPLSGSWHGDWGSSAKERTPIVLFLKWNNKEVEGTLNPGKNGAPLKSVTLNPANWTVHIEGATKDGQAISADGKMGDIGSYNRTITGTWSQGKAKGDFKLKRD
jgi:hypothetical protein